jgi:hypothetical protein
VSLALLLVPRPDSTDPEANPDGPDEARRDDEIMPALPRGVAGLTGLVAIERHLFDPPPGSFAARLLVFRRNHPRLYASRHVVRALGRVTAILLGLAVFVRLLLQPVLDWITDLLPTIELQSIPWPDINWPSIPWPDIDLPDLAVPSWLRVSGVAGVIRRLREAGLADPELSDEEAARRVLTLTDGLLGRGYPEPDRDLEAAMDTVKELIARVLRRPGAS